MMNLGKMHFLSSIEFHLLKVTFICGNGAKKRERFLVSKMEFISTISQRNKNTLPIYSVFSGWVHDIKKAPIINCSRN